MVMSAVKTLASHTLSCNHEKDRWQSILDFPLQTPVPSGSADSGENQSFMDAVNGRKRREKESDRGLLHSVSRLQPFSSPPAKGDSPQLSDTFSFGVGGGNPPIDEIDAWGTQLSQPTLLRFPREPR